MRKPTALYGVTQIALHFGISTGAVCNWRRRYDDTPQPTHEVAGMPLWDSRGLRAWDRWYENRDWQYRRAA